MNEYIYTYTYIYTCIYKLLDINEHLHILIGEIIDVEANVQEPVIDHNQEVDKGTKQKLFALFTNEMSDSERVIRYICIYVYIYAYGD
jgi:hypothetical protein